MNSFTVNLTPTTLAFEATSEHNFGNMTIDKTFSGLLDATSKGQMMSVRTQGGSAGYVAIEEVTGSLEGKKGSFVLQHYGLMDSENSQLILEVVPGTATGELEGLIGSMSIEVVDGEHLYNFNYQL